MNSPIREELEKLLLETDIYSDPVSVKLEAEILVRKAFTAGLKASLLAGPKKRIGENYDGNCVGCSAEGGCGCEIHDFNEALDAHTAKVEEIIKDLEG